MMAIESVVTTIWSCSLLGNYKIPAYYHLLSQSAEYRSQTALWSVQPILSLEDNAPAAADIHVNKGNKYFIC